MLELILGNHYRGARFIRVTTNELYRSQPSAEKLCFGDDAKVSRFHKSGWAGSNHGWQKALIFRGADRAPDFQFDGMFVAVIHQGDCFSNQFFAIQK